MKAAEIIAGLLVLPIIASLLANEAFAWLPYASRTLIRASVRSLPACHRHRYSEEWLADFNTYFDRPLAGVWFAVHIALCARRTARVLRPPSGTRPLMRFVDPAIYAPLADFSCGGPGTDTEDENFIVEDLRRGESTMSVRVAEHPLTGDLLGLYATGRRPLSLSAETPCLRDTEYIGLIGLSNRAAGLRFDGGSTGLGDVLLRMP